MKLPGAHLFTQEFMQEILANWSRDDLLVIYDHQGTRSMDAAAYFQGHGFEKYQESARRNRCLERGGRSEVASLSSGIGR